MTRIHNAPENFAAEAMQGFVDAYGATVRAVPGGVVRTAQPAPGKVALVVGGGSGHYPAFAGYVGRGFADAAVCGDVFASPSTARVCSVARAAHTGGGVILGYGNYAGDVLNFSAAADILRGEGIDVRLLAVTDDVASAAPEERSIRRGIAGDLTVFKLVGAAAERGETLDEVERIAQRANDATHSFGVAFSGCTLPGSAQPLFEVPAGRMGVGLGIHGEAGIDEVDVLSADDLAALLVEQLLGEIPGTPGEAAVVLNGLGATKYEELFVLWAGIAPRLRAAGYTLVAPEVGEFVTSLDMAGCSLTLTTLDDELRELWLDPSEAVAFRRGATSRAAAAPAPVTESAAASATADIDGAEPDVAPASEESRTSATALAAALRTIADMLAEAEDHLGALDAQAGDGDHGQGMARGSAAAAAAIEAAVAGGSGARSALRSAGEGWAERAGGTSGALWGAALVAFADCLSDTAAVRADAVVAGVESATAQVLRLGGAQVGDKTLVDALVPFTDTLRAERDRGASLVEAWTAAARVATDAAEATAALEPRRGRARTAGLRNVGHVDAGAVSFAMVVTALVPALARKDSPHE